MKPPNVVNFYLLSSASVVPLIYYHYEFKNVDSKATQDLSAYCLFAKELLPLYYDENKLHFVTDGVFRIHIPFVRIHNGNWPYMLQGCRYYLTVWILLFPVLCYLLMIAGVWEVMRKVLLLICVFGLLGCLVGVGKYYE